MLDVDYDFVDTGSRFPVVAIVTRLWAGLL